MVLPFLFPLWLILGTAGLEQAKNLAGESSPSDSNPFNDAESAENRARLSRQFAAAVNRLFAFQKRRQLFICARTMKRFPSSRWASAIQIVRPLASTADTQPQLQPALLRLSVIVSSP